MSSHPPPDDTTVISENVTVDRSTLRRASMAGLVGTTLENYDFVIYGTASALVFNKLFFSNVSPAAGVLAAFATYAVGFLARPLGGLFFSHYGDRIGRKWVLVATLFLMGTATFAIGLLPTYATAGLLSPGGGASSSRWRSLGERSGVRCSLGERSGVRRRSQSARRQRVYVTSPAHPLAGRPPAVCV